MQNLNKKASILLWSIFLSLMISAIFISISVKINKSIRENKKLEEKIQTSKSIRNEISKGEKYLITSKDNKKLIINPKNEFETSLVKGEKLSLKISENTNITLFSNEKSILKYKTGTTEYFLREEGTIFANSGETLEIENLGGFARLKLYSEKEVKFPYGKYKVIQKIGNKEINIEEGEIK